MGHTLLLGDQGVAQQWLPFARWALAQARRRQRPYRYQLIKQRILLPDGSVVLIAVGPGVERVHVVGAGLSVPAPVTEDEQVIVLTERGLYLEHGLLSSGLVYLTGALETYYAGSGDPRIDGATDHLYGQRGDVLRGAKGQPYDWPDDLPSDGDASLASAEELAAFNAAWDRKPHYYTGLMRQAAQAHGARSDVVAALAVDSLALPSPLTTGIIRNVDDGEGRLEYWLVQVQPAGSVIALRLVWPKHADALAESVRLGEDQDNNALTVEQRTRFETALLRVLEPAPEPGPGDSGRVVTLADANDWAAVGLSGWSHLDGWPRFRAQPWGSAYESSPAFVLVDCRKGATWSTSDPWWHVRGFEGTITFATDGTPSVTLAKIRDGAWDANGTNPYDYLGVERIPASRLYVETRCRHYCGISPFLGEVPSADVTCTVRMWYDSNGARQELVSRKRVVTSMPANGNAPQWSDSICADPIEQATTGQSGSWSWGSAHTIIEGGWVCGSTEKTVSVSSQSSGGNWEVNRSTGGIEIDSLGEDIKDSFQNGPLPLWWTWRYAAAQSSLWRRANLVKRGDTDFLMDWYNGLPSTMGSRTKSPGICAFRYKRDNGEALYESFSGRNETASVVAYGIAPDMVLICKKHHVSFDELFRRRQFGGETATYFAVASLQVAAQYVAPAVQGDEGDAEEPTLVWSDWFEARGPGDSMSNRPGYGGGCAGLTFTGVKYEWSTGRVERYGTHDVPSDRRVYVTGDYRNKEVTDSEDVIERSVDATLTTGSEAWQMSGDYDDWSAELGAPTTLEPCTELPLPSARLSAAGLVVALGAEIDGAVVGDLAHFGHFVGAT